METWEKRYVHERAAQECRVLSVNEHFGTDFEVPKEEEFGVLKRVKGLSRFFAAKGYWSLMNQRGHNAATFEKCKCSQI